MRTVIVTGSSGLVGSACVEHFARRSWRVIGLDGNQRRDFFGPDGDTDAVARRLKDRFPQTFELVRNDIRNRAGVGFLVEDTQPDLVIHAAAQPSHDLAASRPFDDWETNATGTLNLLEAVRQYSPKASFVFLSTNKVYGDAPNNIPRVELPTRWEYSEEADHAGVNERLPIDQSRHSLFGVSKAAADLMVQEYGRAFGLNTVCFRCGCLTGAAHAGAEQHGFLAYLVKCCRESRPYTVHGYKGKQVRDQLHAVDVALACDAFAADPRPAAVYNLGGGRENSISVLEAISAVEKRLGKSLAWTYSDTPRAGDHICYYSDTSRFRRDYPEWSVTMTLENILSELTLTA